MREREVLRWLAQRVPSAGDDCAVIPFAGTHLVVTTDMLWRKIDFPDGVTAYTMGWRAVAVSLSDIAAMGAKPLGVVLALGAPSFERLFLDEMLQGVIDSCQSADTLYLGGDLSQHQEMTLVSSAVGEVKRPVRRSGAKPGDLVCVTGSLGRTAAALKLFEQGEHERANRLFRFTPRIAEGLALAPHATSMMDISDGLARSLYQLGEASGVGFCVRFGDFPIDSEVASLARDESELREMALYTGEDFELLFTLPTTSLQQAQSAAPFAVIGGVTQEGIWMEENGSTVGLADRGYEH